VDIQEVPEVNGPSLYSGKNYRFSSCFGKMRNEKPQSLALEESIIPIAAILVAVAIPFIMYGLKRGEGQTVTTTNVYNLRSDVTNMEKRLGQSCEDTKRRFDGIYETLNEMGGDIKLHTNQISTLQVEISKMEDRLRAAETNIVRLQRNGG
jgi:septal ring factor EnvC (AmiA/AmiB activator)